MAYGHINPSALRLCISRPSVSTRTLAIRKLSSATTPAAARSSSISSFATTRRVLAPPRTNVPNALSLSAALGRTPIALNVSSSFHTSSVLLKDRPPKKDAVEEEEVDEESKRKEKEELEKTKESRSSGPPKISDILKGGAASGAGASGNGSSGSGSDSGNKAGSNTRALQRPSVPDIYPQVLALPITKRPLFPGFYKAVTIREPSVALAFQDMMKRGQPYIGAFLIKDEKSDKDTIENLDEVHDVGVFAQVTSVFPPQADGSLTVVLYPHRRIRITKLINHHGETATDEHAAEEGVKESEEAKEVAREGASEAAVEEVEGVKWTEEDQERKEKGDIVASFEEGDEQQPRPSTHAYATAFLKNFKVSLADVENMVDEPIDKKSDVVKAITSEIINVFKDVANLNSLFRDQISTFSMSQSAGNIIEEPAKLADFAAAISAGETAELQSVLEDMNIESRLTKALTCLKKELMNAQLQSKIAKDVESRIQKRQREYWLAEQIKGIRRELGIESDGKDKLVEKFKEKAAKLAMPEAVKKVFDEEINKLAHLEAAASEFNVTRNYLDWLTQIPWGQRSTENYNIAHAVSVLDEDHYGLKDVKDRILEFIAVGKLRGTVEGKIICFVGPPGVGKTSIGKSIARALQRQFYRFSVGGLTDVAEIKGHRRTYVGALPGRIIQALKKCQTENPLVLIDEVDKIGRGHQGDPSSALLELLDPEQNSAFLDHYMDVPVDLSKVLFVCTANMTDTIPRPLLDRMEVIELSGYVADEKMAIADKYLAPQAKELSGLKEVKVNLQQDAIEELIKSYCRESGVRNLKKQIEKVFRKSALKIVKDLGEEALPEEKAITDEGKAAAEDAEKQKEAIEESAEPEKKEVKMDSQTSEHPRVALKVPDTVDISITKDNLKDYVGPPIFTSDRLYDKPPPGVVMGLAWTQMGGAALYIESILENSLSSPSSRGPGLETTGSLKDVMRESTTVAYSFAKGMLTSHYPGNRFFEKARIHLHCPEGATPKDGPSAGITMATSLLSLALKHEISPEIAMTGELTVTGKVLRIGGLREKTVAARRSGAKMVLFPAENLSDWLELPENIKEGIEGRPVGWYNEVLDICFEGVTREDAAGLWKNEMEEAEKRERSERKRRGKEGEEED